VHRKFKRSLLLMDGARWHRTKCARAYLAKHKGILVLWLPRYSPEMNPMEECWRQPKNELLLKLYPSFDELRKAIAMYYRTKRFKLNLINYLFRS
jgi:transposase